MSEIKMKAGVEITCNKCGTTTNPPITNKDLEENEFIPFTCSGCGLTEQIYSKKIIEMVKKKAVEEIQKELDKRFR